MLKRTKNGNGLLKGFYKNFENLEVSDKINDIKNESENKIKTVREEP